MARTPPKRLPAGERRALIESAAAELFAERGYAGATLERIAAAAGVTKPVLYRHFAGKKALHMALLERHRDELLGELARNATAEGLLEQRIPRILDAWFAYVERNPYAWRMLFRDTTGDPEIQAFHRELQRSARELTAALIAGEPGLSIPDRQLEPTAELIRAATTGLALWWLDNPGLPRAVLVEAATRLLRDGIAP